MYCMVMAEWVYGQGRAIGGMPACVLTHVKRASLGAMLWEKGERVMYRALKGVEPVALSPMYQRASEGLSEEPAGAQQPAGPRCCRCCRRRVQGLPVPGGADARRRPAAREHQV